MLHILYRVSRRLLSLRQSLGFRRLRLNGDRRDERRYHARYKSAPTDHSNQRSVGFSRICAGGGKPGWAEALGGPLQRRIL